MNISRRTFLKSSAVLGGAAVGLPALISASKESTPDMALENKGLSDPVEGKDNVEIKYSVCLMCHSACGIRAKIKDGVLIKIDGNPYHPNCMEPHIPFDTDPAEAIKYVGSVCVKGQAGIKELYDPLRIKHPLKRAGPRGSGKWQVITWEQAVEEIVEGGDLFGEGHVDGFRDIRDLDTPINPDAPELGSKANQLCVMVGRAEHGRKEFTDRFFKSAFGTVNYRNDHTSICETSHHVGLDLCLDGKHHIKPDIINSEYILWFGTSPVEANFPMQTLARKLMEFKARGGKMVVIDPRFSNTAAKADQWVPIKPGTDAAFALGMMRYIIENGRYDTEYLENTTKDAAANDKHKTWGDATYLVRLDDMTMLRADDAGIADGTHDQFVVINGGNPVAFDSVEHGDLETDTTVNGIACKSVFTLLKERVNEKTIEEYAQICGMESEVIEQVAYEFTEHGRKVCADFYRGPVQHTNGTYNARSIAILNFLVGNVSWKGGCEAHGGSHWHETGGKSGNPYNLAKELHPGKVNATGVPIERHKVKYEDSTEFGKNGYPARRPWFPFAYNFNHQEVIPSIGMEYPYPIKALVLIKANPNYSTPAGRIYEEVLKDTKKVPLLITFDTNYGETSALTDYILPDRKYLERYATPHVAPAVLTTVSGIRTPVVDPVYPDTMIVEDFLIQVGKRMDLPGYGDNGFGKGDPLNTAADWYNKCFVNIASEGDGVAGFTEEERLQYVLARGGRFEDYEKAYSGKYTTHGYKKQVFIYSEKLAKQKDSMTGKPYDGLPLYQPLMDCMGNEVKDAGYDFHLNTYKQVYHCQSRTAHNEWLMEILPENPIEISAADGKRLGIRNGDMMKVTSPTNAEGVIGRAQLREGLRPGVINISHHYGHWEYGSKPHKENGADTGSASYIGKGVSGNPVMRLDPYLNDVTLQDPIGGSSSFYDTKVKLVKV